MWQVNNITPFCALPVVLRDREGAETLVIAVSGTFKIKDDRTVIDDVQQEVVHIPIYRGDPSASSLIRDSEAVITKPTTDVLVLGQAYAPRGRPCARLDASIKIEAIDKTVTVWGDRCWDSGRTGVRVTDPLPFETMPIVYERAFGGISPRDPEDPPQWDERNPAGTGFVTRPTHVAGVRLPNVEAPERLITSWRDRPTPAGLGPIARHWSPRRQLGGTYDETWQTERLPLPPSDFDDRFYQSAPSDQQAPSYLRGGERVELVNLSASGRLRFTLPRVHLVFYTRIGNEVHDHRAQLYTVVIEPDQLRITMGWQTSLRCHNQATMIRRINIREKPVIG